MCVRLASTLVAGLWFSGCVGAIADHGGATAGGGGAATGGGGAATGGGGAATGGGGAATGGGGAATGGGGAATGGGGAATGGGGAATGGGGAATGGGGAATGGGGAATGGGGAATGGGGAATGGGGAATGGGAGASGVRLLYMDLLSGPQSGGEAGAGAIVTLFGRGFGVTRGHSTVTIGAGEVARYLLWSDTKVAVQVGAANTTGSVIVHSEQGESDAMHFTVRGGAIRCVGPAGSDAATGLFGACWRTWRHAVTHLQAGDTLYFLDGFTQTTDDGTGWNAATGLSPGWGLVTGTATQPVALVAYPEALVTLGALAGPSFGVRLVQSDGQALSHYVFSGLRIRGASIAMAISGGAGHRVVGCDLSSPNTHTQSGCFTASETSAIALLGNEVHDCGTASSDKQDHTVYSPLRNLGTSVPINST